MKKVMMMALMTCFILSSCSKETNNILNKSKETNNILNKSIFTPLSIDELAVVLKTDSTFYDVYDVCIRLNKEMDDLNKAKYIDITYIRFQKFINYYNNVKFNNDSLMHYDKLCYEFAYSIAGPPCLWSFLSPTKPPVLQEEVKSVDLIEYR